MTDRLSSIATEYRSVLWKDSWNHWKARCRALHMHSNCCLVLVRCASIILFIVPPFIQPIEIWAMSRKSATQTAHDINSIATIAISLYRNAAHYIIYNIQCVYYSCTDANKIWYEHRTSIMIKLWRYRKYEKKITHLWTFVVLSPRH